MRISQFLKNLRYHNFFDDIATNFIFKNLSFVRKLDVMDPSSSTLSAWAKDSANLSALSLARDADGTLIDYGLFSHF